MLEKTCCITSQCLGTRLVSVVSTKCLFFTHDSEAFPPEDTSSLADSVQAGSSVGEGDSVRGEAGSSVGEGDSVRGESSLAKEDYVGSDISVGEECK